MATEAQNIMQAFYAANKREEVKEEEREFKKGALGYMGGIPGFLFDTAGAMEGAKMFQSLGEGIETLTDQRSPAQQVADEYVERMKTEKEALSILNAMGIDYNPNLSIADIMTNVFNELPDMMSKIIGSEKFVEEVDRSVSSVKLNALDSNGNKFSYQLGGMTQFQPGQGMLKRFGQ